MYSRRFFAALWQDYATIAPQAAAIRDLFAAHDETVVDDHIAFRTFARAPITRAKLAVHLLGMGYSPFAEYAFPDKHVVATAYVPPRAELPRVFLSELLVDELSDQAQRLIDGLVEQIDHESTLHDRVFHAGRLWSPIAYEDYQRLAAESEYAAWVAAFGLRANHFTVSVNALQRYPTLEAVLDLVEQAGFALNTIGGRIKGSPEQLLEQASTLAAEVPVAFTGDRLEMIPSCYYEFARRYADAHGQLYQGFIAASADKIFHSTDRRSA